MTTKIKAGVIGDGVVGTTQIADDAVTSAKLDTNIAVAGTLTVTGDANFDSNTLFVDASANNVGIGTSSPDAKLHVVNAATEEYIFETTSNNTRSQVEVKSKDSSGNAVQARLSTMGDGTYGMLYTFTNHNLTFATNNAAPQMTLDTSGNVGIGITNPSTRTHIYSSASSTPLIVESTANTYVGIKNTTQTAYIGAVTSNMIFENNGAEAMRIDSNGNLLIGTTSYATGAFGSAFGINISATRPQVVLKNETYSTDAYFGLADNLWLGTQDSMSLRFATNDAERMRINSYGGAQFYSALRSNAKKAEIHNGEGLYVYNNGGGNPVDYGTGAEIRLADLSHGVNATHYIALSGSLPGYSAGQYNCLKTDLGDLHFVAGGVYTGYIGANTGFTDISDEREKENITTITNATEKLKQLRGVYHTWKDTENKGTDTHIGLIAQEVEAVVPEVVSTSNPTSLNTPKSDTAGLKGVAYAKLVPLLIETIKELEERITTLENA